ncbi:MAG: preprotein translocase subunit SecE [Clostridia bacterium]|nr:preprotein translocase subunit SecE [Clostridia bacterium]
MANNEKEKKQKNSYFFKELRTELKKVVWPTPKELVNNTFAVIMFVIIIGAIVFVLDFCFDNLNKYGIVKFQEKIQSTVQNENNEESSEDADSVDDSVHENSEKEEETNVEENIEENEKNETVENETVENEETSTEQNPVE